MPENKEMDGHDVRPLLCSATHFIMTIR